MTRSFSPLSTALTANKEILPTWQNISRVTFHKAGFVPVKNKELSTSPELGQAGLVLLDPLQSHRVGSWLQGLDQVFFHMLDSPGEGQNCPAQLQELQRMWLMWLLVALWVCSKLHQRICNYWTQGGLLLLPQLPGLFIQIISSRKKPTWILHVAFSHQALLLCKQLWISGDRTLSEQPCCHHPWAPPTLFSWRLHILPTPVLQCFRHILFLPILAGKTGFTSKQRHYQKISLPSQWKHLKSITDVERMFYPVGKLNLEVSYLQIITSLSKTIIMKYWWKFCQSKDCWVSCRGKIVSSFSFIRLLILCPCIF